MTRKAYKSDLTDAQWLLIKPLIPPAKPGGHPRTVDMREILNGIFYVLRTGCSWEMMPHDLPPYSTVYYYFRRWQRQGVWQQINNALRQKVRKLEGREPSASAAIADSQSVKTTEKKGNPMLPLKNEGSPLRRSLAPPTDTLNTGLPSFFKTVFPGEVYGFDGGKLVKGRKRHVVVDTQGLLLGVVVTEANTQDRVGAAAVIMEDSCDSGKLKLIWVDQGYSGERFAQAIALICGAEVEVVKRTEPGFEVLPRRWVVERTFGWLGRYRRLSKDYELLPEVSEAMIYGAMVRLMLNRLAS